MIKQDTIKLLADLGRNQFGKALKEYLEDKSEAIKDVTTATSWEETQGRKIAMALIKELFSFLEDKPVVKKKGRPTYE